MERVIKAIHLDSTGPERRYRAIRIHASYSGDLGSNLGLETGCPD
jgi:hypothetical protein